MIQGKRYQLYVGNLTWWTTDADIADAVLSLGVNDFLEVKFYENRANGQSKGFCCVSLGSDSSSRTVIIWIFLFISIIIHTISQKTVFGLTKVPKTFFYLWQGYLVSLFSRFHVNISCTMFHNWLKKDTFHLVSPASHVYFLFYPVLPTFAISCAKYLLHCQFLKFPNLAKVSDIGLFPLYKYAG